MTTNIKQLGIVGVLLLSLIAGSCAPAVSTSPYTERNFTVGVDEKYTIGVELRVGHTIEGDFSVSGRQDYIDFYIKDEFGGLAYGVIRVVGSHSFTAEAKYSGTYTLYFDNSFSWGTSRHVALRYRLR